MRHAFACTSLGLAIACAAAPYAAAFTLSEPPKIAFLYFAEKTDGGWTQAFDEARPKIEEALGMKIPFVENVPEVAGQSGRRPSDSSSAGTTSSSAPPSAIPIPSRSFRRNIPKVAFLNASGTTNGPESRVLLRPHLREPISVRHGGRRHVEDRQARLRRGASDRTRELDDQRLPARRAADEPQGDGDGDLHRVMERPRQGTCRRAGARRTGHRRHRPARGHADAADRRAGARHLRHRSPPRPARVCTQGDAVLVRLDVGQASGADTQEARGWKLAAERRTAPSPASRTAEPTSPAATLSCRRTSSTR